MRTATWFSLALFPQVFLFQRILLSDVVFVLTDRVIDERNHVNKCVIRATSGAFRDLIIPIEPTPQPPTADLAKVEDPATWLNAARHEIRRAYRNLHCASAAEQLFERAVASVHSEWLTDYLMSTLVETMNYLGMQSKDVVRGDTAQRRQYVNDNEYIFQLCEENEIDRLIIGRNQQAQMNQRMFRRNEVELCIQRYEGPKQMPSRDSMLDACARMPPRQIVELMKQ